MLKFELNVAERKTLARRMEELTGIHPYYTKAPLYAYDIGDYTIDRDGNLLVEPENADAELLTSLLNEGLIRNAESTDVQPENAESAPEEEQPTEAEPEVPDEQESEADDFAEQNEPAEVPEPDDTAEDEPEEESWIQGSRRPKSKRKRKTSRMKFLWIWNFPSWSVSTTV